MRSNEVFLRRILEEMDFILQHTQAMSFEEFMNDGVLKRACARSLEIIGEAVKNISATSSREPISRQERRRMNETQTLI